MSGAACAIVGGLFQAGSSRMTEDVNAYDDFPYQTVALAETHPERLAAIATLFGLTPAPVETARILELGCAGGGNILPLASIFPNAEFVGVDLSPRQIDDAKSAASTAGISNVSFHAKSISDITPEFGKYDYIICHGVYSWVPDDVKEAILRVASENLMPNGLAYVSYNTFPGWHIPGMIREMMLYHVREIPEQKARVAAARAFLDFLGTNVPDREGNYAKMLREEAEQLKPHADSYVAHEHLETLNHPVYFHEFEARVRHHHLQIMADSRVWAMASSAQPKLAATLDRLSRDPVAREQYNDFLVNRRFRRSILCHEDITPSAPNFERIKQLRISAAVWPTTTPVQHASKVSYDFRAVDGVIRLSTSDPLFKTFLMNLTEVMPRSLTFDELWTMTKTRLSRGGVDPGSNPDALATRLLQAYLANAVELHSFEPPFPVVASDKPEALPMARIAAESTQVVPTFRLRQATLSEFDRLVIRNLNGQRTRSEIVDKLLEAVLAGKFTIQQNGVPLKDAETIRPILERSLGPSLDRMIGGGLLVR